MIEVIEQTADRAKLDHDLIVPITTGTPYWKRYHAARHALPISPLLFR